MSLSILRLNSEGLHKVTPGAKSYFNLRAVSESNSFVNRNVLLGQYEQSVNHKNRPLYQNQAVLNGSQAVLPKKGDQSIPTYAQTA